MLHLRLQPPTAVSLGKGKGPKPSELSFYLFTMYDWWHASSVRFLLRML